MKETECACDQCKSMCVKQPCIGTPQDILKLLKKGYTDKLAMSTWMLGVVTDTYGKPVDMIQPLYIKEKGCAFLDDKGLCTLHDAGLKPTEGKMSHHTDHEHFSGKFEDTINYKVAMSWIDEIDDDTDTSEKMLVRVLKKALDSE